jgi:hypothetical protein
MSNLFNMKKPKIEAATRMPDREDSAAMAAKRARIQTDLRRGGRDSTIMSDNLVGATGKLGA